MSVCTTLLVVNTTRTVCAPCITDWVELYLLTCVRQNDDSISRARLRRHHLNRIESRLGSTRFKPTYSFHITRHPSPPPLEVHYHMPLWPHDEAAFAPPGSFPVFDLSHMEAKFKNGWLDDMPREYRAQ